MAAPDFTALDRPVVAAKTGLVIGGQEVGQDNEMFVRASLTDLAAKVVGRLLVHQVFNLKLR